MMGTHTKIGVYKASLTTLILAMAILPACGEQPTTFVPGVTDSFQVHEADTYKQADALLQADYVFVLDYSKSMSDKSAEIIANMSKFGGYLEDQEIDYRVGIVQGTFQGNVGAASAWPRVSTDFVGPFLSLDNKGTMSADVAAQIAPLGGDNAPNRRSILESALKTMDAKAADFLRPAAQLVYVFMSDNDDTSNTDFTKGTTAYPNDDRTPSFYDTRLTSYKLDEAYVSSRSYTAGVATSCPLQNTGAGGDAAGTRIAAASRALDEKSDFPTAVDGCVYKPTTDQLQDIARNVTKPTKQFILRGKPLSGTVRVWVNGIEVLADGNWDFDIASNQLTFQDGKEPAPSAKLKIGYEQGFYLTKKPKLSTVQVLIDGLSVPQDANNGWSFVESEMRIKFNGGVQPDNDAKLTITYQAE